MTTNRRTMLLGAAAVVAAGGLAAYLWRPADRAADITPAAVPARTPTVADGVASPLGDRALGSADAPVTIIEYASATCPHCARFHEDTFKTLKSEYIDTGKVRYVFREFPFDDLALAAFMLARCAPEDKYFPILDMLFEQQRTWAGENAREELFKIAQLAGFSRDGFDTCLKNEEVAKGILATRESGASSLGVDSTPTFFINGEVLRGNQDIAEFRKRIDPVLN